MGIEKYLSGGSWLRLPKFPGISSADVVRDLKISVCGGRKFFLIEATSQRSKPFARKRPALSMLKVNFLTTFIASSLLQAAMSVGLAKASLLIIVEPSFFDSQSLFSRNNRKQAPAILLLPSTNA
jgi:hypothetical protein